MATTSTTKSSAKTLEQLLANMQGQSYTPLTDEEIKKQAEGRYQSVYDQKRLSANQAYETSDQALAQQLAGLQASYDKQREESKEGYEQTYAQADRQALSRGMQRSSYNNATLANINVKGQKALQEINDAQAAQEQNINQQRTLAAQQLATQMAQYEASQLADELAYADELAAREYERQFNSQTAQNQLAMSIYNAQFGQEESDREQSNWQTSMDYQKTQDAQEQENWQTSMDYQKTQDAQEQENWLKNYEFQQAQFEHQKAQDALAQSNWEKQFNAQYGGKKSSGGGSGGSSPYKKDTTDETQSLWDVLGSGLTGSFSGSSGMTVNKHTNTKATK